MLGGGISWLILGAVCFLAILLFWRCLVAPFFLDEAWRENLSEMASLEGSVEGRTPEEVLREMAKQWAAELGKGVLAMLHRKFRVVAELDRRSPSGKKFKFQMRVGFAWNTVVESWNERYFIDASSAFISDVVSSFNDSMSRSWKPTVHDVDGKNS